MQETAANSSRVIFLPGLGGDERLFGPQQAAFANSRVLPWLAAEPGEALADYASRMADQIDEDAGEQYTLVGVSFGGMLSLEMTRHLRRCRSLVLVGSSRSGRAVSRRLRLAYEFTKNLPLVVFEWLRPAVPWAVHGMPGVDQRQRELLAAMGADLDFRFVRWAASAIMNWHFDEDRPLPVPVRHIHGDRDDVLPLDMVRPDAVVPGGGHLISLTHADQVNAFIADSCRR